MDLRKPIGLLFTVVGLILVIWGAIGTKTPFTEGGILDRQGNNINLIWGAVLLLFGIVMAAFAKRAEKSE